MKAERRGQRNSHGSMDTRGQGYMCSAMSMNSSHLDIGFSHGQTRPQIPVATGPLAELVAMVVPGTRPAHCNEVRVHPISNREPSSCPMVEFVGRGRRSLPLREKLPV